MELYNYNELGMVSRQKVMSATKRNTDYLAYAIEKTREYCERQLYKMGMPRNSTNAYVTWRNMTTLADGRVSHDISIDFRIVTIGNKVAARQVVDALVPDENKISDDTRDLMGDFDLSYAMTEILFKCGGEWRLDDEDIEDVIHWMTDPAQKMFSDVAFRGREYLGKMFYDSEVDSYLSERNPICFVLPDLDGFCGVCKI